MLKITIQITEDKDKEKCYKTRCWNCGCKFIYQDEDTTLNTYLEGNFYKIECPFCKHRIYLSFRKRCFRYKIKEVVTRG